MFNNKILYISLIAASTLMITYLHISIFQEQSPHIVLIEGHQGKICIESPPGLGTEVTVELPYRWLDEKGERIGEPDGAK